MDGLDPGFVRDAQNVPDIEIRFDRPLAAADEIALIRLGAVQREAVLLRVDGHGPQAELARGPHDTDGDLSTVGDQNASNSLRHDSLRL